MLPFLQLLQGLAHFLPPFLVLQRLTPLFRLFLASALYQLTQGVFLLQLLLLSLMTFLPRLKLPAFFVRFLAWCFPIQGVGALLIQEVNRSVLLRSLFQLLLLLQHLYPHWLFLCYLGRLLSLTQ